MKKLFAITLLLVSVQSFATVHFVSRTLAPTAEVSYYAAKAASYPVRHPVKTVKGLAKAIAVIAKTTF